MNRKITNFCTLGACVLLLSCFIFDFSGSSTVKYIISLNLMIFTYFSLKNYCYSGKISPLNKAVLITGCDSGFGHGLAKRLDSGGFHVFACCLFPDGEGGSNLKQTCSSRLKVLPLDVTKDESVENALTFVKENLGSNVLWAIVNNAGISAGFSLDFSTIQNFKDTLDVNTLGPVRVTKAFLPLLKKSKGRVINVASNAGRLIVTDICAYIMSKHAVVAFSECLSLEMNPWGVRVISIEPQTFRTQITNYEKTSRQFDEALKEIDKDILSSYGEDYIQGIKKIQFKFSAYASSNIDIVLDDMESAISERNPNRVYKPSINLLNFVIQFIMENLPRGLYEQLFRIWQKLLGYPSLNVEKKNY